MRRLGMLFPTPVSIFGNGDVIQPTAPETLARQFPALSIHHAVAPPLEAKFCMAILVLEREAILGATH